jgi:acetoacetate decarboxylase
MPRYLPRLSAGCHHKSAVNELAMSITDNLTVAEAWIGEGELNRPEAHGEELHVLAPKRLEPRFGYSLSFSVTDLKILEDRTNVGSAGRMLSAGEVEKTRNFEARHIIMAF